VTMHPHLQREIDKLKKKLLIVSANVETAMHRAVKSLKDRDHVLAQQVIDNDIEIDKMEVDVEEEGLKILALYNPVAVDLRFVVAVLKINNDLERIGDQAANIAARTQFLEKHPSVEIPAKLTVMSNAVQSMLNKCLNAFVQMDTKLAREVMEADDQIDTLHKEMFGLVQDRIRGNIDQIESLINILSVSRQLERIADQVTNIAEDVIYMVGGNIVRHRGI
jgi:phosphate transport system protein